MLKIKIKKQYLKGLDWIKKEIDETAVIFHF